MAKKAGRVALISAGIAAALCVTSPIASAAPLAGGSGVSAGTTPQRIGSTPHIPVGAHKTGATSASTELHLSVNLKPRDPAALTAFVKAVSTPGDPQYRHYLATGQFAKVFGPTQQTVDAVRAALKAAGLKPGRISSDGLSIPVTATTSQAGQAFNTAFQNVTMANGKQGFVTTVAPSLPADIASQVTGIVGLSNVSTYVSHAQPVGRTAVGKSVVGSHTVSANATGPAFCSGAVSAFNGWGKVDTRDYYSPGSLASAYSMPHGYTTGSGQTIAVFELENVDHTSLNQWQGCLGTHTAISYTAVDGGPTITPDNNQYGIESLLDIEDLVALAPGATIHDYMGPDAQNATDANVLDTYRRIVSDNSAQVISSSWGECETAVNTSDPQMLSAENTVFQMAAAQGQSVVAASGDAGSSDCSRGNSADLSFQVDDPASQPYVTGVGGTHLSGLGSSLKETVWNNGTGRGAGGGGVSKIWPAQPFQSGFASVSGRAVPDVSALGDPYSGYPLIYTDRTPGDQGYNQEVVGIIGGTSGAAPTWAAAIAQANSTATCLGGRAGYLNPVLYQAAKKSYSTGFRDITSGNNDISGDGTATYSAKTGYDEASGLGSPKESGLAGSLCRQHDLLARDAGGNLWQYQGTGKASGVYAARTLVSSGWNTYNMMTLPDGHDSLGGGDMFARDASGTLWLLQGSGTAGTPFNAPVRIGGGWNIYNSIVGVGSVGTGGTSLIARDASGVLWLYQGTNNPSSPLKSRVRVGGGWSGYNAMVGVGTIGSNHNSDLLTRDASGVLWLYQGTGNASAPFGARIRVGGGWNIYTSIVGARDLNGDGKNDVVARDASGVLWLYEGTNNPSAPYGARIRIGSGWNTYNQLIG
ncbi:protease pro-enzyme activation domain-containing protein [Streptacidiphilus neutrinimicus]|uniref:protease pro-enzyme activation domain-containing protein n=1 Tax=Streptacidiphilus neutrinimicus TaxID=105420 RepID=UPI0005A9BEE4|nr:protease pro-enzyme activation domain-containing protein [Streptacidiphilus neutrinimicus]